MDSDNTYLRNQEETVEYDGLKKDAAIIQKPSDKKVRDNVMYEEEKKQEPMSHNSPHKYNMNECNTSLQRNELLLSLEEEEKRFDSILMASSSVFVPSIAAAVIPPPPPPPIEKKDKYKMKSASAPTPPAPVTPQSAKARKRWLSRSKSDTPTESSPFSTATQKTYQDDIQVSDNARSLALSAGKALWMEKDLDPSPSIANSSVVSADRVEAQRLLILKNRRLQDHLRDLQSAQRKEINGLKKALGVQDVIIEESHDSSLLYSSQCSSIGDIDEIYGGGLLTSAFEPAPASPSSPSSKAASSTAASSAPKTPLRIRLKRRILRHQRNHSPSTSPHPKFEKDRHRIVSHTLTPEKDDRKSKISTIQSYAHSYQSSRTPTKCSKETQSDVMPSYNRLHSSEPTLPLPLAPTLSFESGCDIQEVLPCKKKNLIVDSDDEISVDSLGCDSHNSLKRLSRQVRMGRRGEVPTNDLQYNRVMIHVYDLIPSETMVKLPWGCDFPLGQCFNMVNSGLHMMGTGAYHVGVEVNGIEYAFGANNVVGLSGVFTCLPRKSTGYDYRCTLDFGTRRTVRRSWISVPDPNFVDLTKRRRSSTKSQMEHAKSCASLLEMDDPPSPIPTPPQFSKSSIPTVYREVETFVQGHELMQQMAREYLGCDYDLLRKNCCTFARDTCLRLGVNHQEIPSWFLSLAEAGVATENCVAGIESNVVSPLKRILSGENDPPKLTFEDDMTEDGRSCSGFEVIAKRKRGSQQHTELEIVRIVESQHGSNMKHHLRQQHQQPVIDETSPFGHAVGIRHTLSWTY